MYTWQIPSAWPKTGIWALCFCTDRTKSFEPRGMTRSMYLPNCSKSETCSRVLIYAQTSEWTTARVWIKNFTRAIASPGTYGSNASCMSLVRISLEYFASEPPFNRRPLPEQIDNAAICGKLSGRDSNITRRTPIGVVICFSMRPSARRVRRTTCPTDSME